MAMSDIVIHENKEFSGVDYSEKKLRDRSFIKCKFVGCNFTKSDIRGNDFETCEFICCNFSLTVVGGTGFRNAHFKESKLLGVNFSECNKFMFSFAFDDCYLDYSSFFGTKLKKTNFNRCSLKETDFSETDLSGAVFLDCDLTGTHFSKTILEKADFRMAKNFTIDPENNKLKHAKFSAFNLDGLLYKYQIIIE